MKRLVFVTYLIIILVVFARALLPASDQLLYGDDVHRQYYFFRVYFLDSLKQGIIPWWNPYVFSGVPFLANAQVSMQYPLNWLYVLLPLNLAYSWYFALHIFIAMMSMYWFMRKFVSPFPAWVSGLVFGLSGYFFARTLAGQPDVVASAAYVPLVIGLFYELVRSGGRKNLVLAAFALGIQALVGYQIVTLFTLEAVGILALVRLLRLPKSLKPARIATRSVAGGELKWRLKNLSYVVLAVALGLGLAAVQIVPAAEFFRHSIRAFDLPYSFASGGAINWKDLLTLFNPYALGDHLFYTGSPPNWHEHQAFVGVTALVLAVAGLVYVVVSAFRGGGGLGKFGKFGVLVAVIGFFSLWVSFAHNAPLDIYYLLWKIFPMYHYIRIPSRQLILFVFALAGLAGYTISLIKLKLLRLLILGAILFELLPFAQRLVRLEKTPQTRHDQELVKLLQSEKEPVRINPNFGVWLPPRDSLDFQSPMQYRYFSTTGYDPSILKNYYEFIDAINGKAETSVLDHNVQVPYAELTSPYFNFLNAKYILVPASNDSVAGLGSKFKFVKEDQAANYRLYEYKNYQPRFFFVPEAQMVENREELKKLIINRSVDLNKKVLLSFGWDSGLRRNDIAKKCLPDQTVEVNLVLYAANEINLHVDSPCDGYLVSSEVWYPGWEAKIDDKPSEVLEANLAFRSVYVPEGKHEIQLYYRPTIFVIGGVISLISLVICFVLMRNSKIKP